MKKILQKTAFALGLLLAFAACQDDDHTFGDINSPDGLQVTANLVGKDAAHPDGDGSGIVDFVAKANHAISYKYIFSDGTTANAPSGILSKRFSQPGTHTYTITVLANGTAGVSATTTFELTVRSDFSDPDAVQALTGGASKKWYWAAAEPAHLGVGPNNTNPDENYKPIYYGAGPFEKAGSPSSSCLYESEMTFSLDNGILKFVLDNKGHTFFNTSFESVVGGSAGSDNCYDYDTSGTKIVSLVPSESLVTPEHSTGTTMQFSDNGFMGYYIGTSTYEILSITDNKMVVRAVMGGNNSLAWYHTFTTTPPVQPGTDNFTNLVFSDEFNTDGAPDASKWGYNLGNNNGWGNNEAEYYTDSPDNVKVEGGSLKITAKKQTMGGFQYTSARLVSENKFDFKYGKVEFRAKMPSGGGTWPALWMLGKNYTTNAWPTCGEIDVMEHRGNAPNVIHGTLHYPGHSGANGNTNSTTIANASTDFHIYSVVWSAASIRFFVDGQLYHSYVNEPGSPFNLNFFLIMNVAMGGNFGGNIDPNFTQSTMEVDYVKVFQ